jgi:hypothetical protein
VLCATAAEALVRTMATTVANTIRQFDISMGSRLNSSVRCFL